MTAQEINEAVELAKKVLAGYTSVDWPAPISKALLSLHEAVNEAAKHFEVCHWGDCEFQWEWLRKYCGKTK